MPVPAAYSDGDFTTATQQGPVVTHYDEEKKTNIYTQTLWQFADDWAAAPDSLTLNDAYLIEESQPSPVLGNVVEWKRIFADLPPARDERESTTYAYTYNGSSFGELPFIVQQRTHYDYFYTDDPEADIEQLRAYRLVNIGGVLVYLGTAPGEDDTELIAEDSIYRRWKRNIYERVTKYVPVLVPTLLP